MLEFARWKYILVLLVSLLALVFAAPNFFGSDLAVQVSRKDRANVDAAGSQAIEAALKAKGVAVKRTYIDGGRAMLLFDAVDAQYAARDVVNETLSDTYISALSSAARAPEIFRKVGLRPMPLGLDLRGGLYLLYQVDVNGAVGQLIDSYEQDFRRALTAAKVQFTDAGPLTDSDGAIIGVRVTFAPGANLTAARDVMKKVVSDAAYTIGSGTVPSVDATLTKAQLTERKRNAIQQNMVTLRNRVGELGVTEPEVRQQGLDRISVALPGITNSAEVKDILGKVATLEFRMKYGTDFDAQEALEKGRTPIGSRLYYLREQNGVRRPTLLKREVIATGDQLVDASTTATQDGPGVAIRLNSQAGDQMLRITQANLGKPMAVVLSEQTREKYTDVDGTVKERDVKKQEVISEAVIRGVFSNQFNITGLGQGEARDLALLMRSGQLAAPLTAISERTIGPSLGQQNIDSGVRALLIGSALLFLFMILYYHVFGVVASVVLLANVVLLTALLSMMKASLSLPGMAGILLTVGMAVDANVIIYERIREEIRNGMSPQASIRAGFEKAWSAIWDSNATTFIAGMVLWVLGTGPIRNFAVVLVLGIGTSMFMAMLGSRALLTLIYGGKGRTARLSIG
jgi:preprotein translocase subunit SecD